MHATRWACLLGAMVAAAPLTAHADTVDGTRSGERLRERRHEIDVSLSAGHATLRVRRTVHNGGERHDQALFFIDVPQGAVATGLRTLGSLEGRPQWFAGELLEAEEAAARYRELTGIGGYYPKDPALLSWRSQDLLALQVFPVAPASEKTVEYTLTLPTHYQGGMHHVELPALGTDTLLATLRVRAAEGTLYVDDERRSSGTRVTFEKKGAIRDLALAPARPPTLGGALAVVPFAEDGTVVRYRIEAAPELSEVPRGARAVVLLDASRSRSDEAVKAQIAAARAYLAHLPDAQAEVMLFHRRVLPRHGRFVPVKRALADLESLSVTRENGSDVEGALVAAQELLEKAPPRAPKRILVLTDTFTRQALIPERLRASMTASGAIVHVGMIEEGAPHLERADDHDWAELVRDARGVVWRGLALGAASSAEAMRRTFEEWARPIRIHRLALSAPSVDAFHFEHGGELAEGEGLSSAWIQDEAPPWLLVEGELWAEPIRRMLRVDGAESDRWAALVFGSPLVHELDEKDMMPLAKRGHAVSPVTSFLAIEPGVRPSTEGLDEGEAFGVGGLGLIGVGSGGGGRGQGIGGFEHERWLAKELGGGWRLCGGTDGATVTLETTLREVVHVASVTPKKSQPAAAQCLRDKIWALDLPQEFRPVHATWNVTL